MTEQQKKIIDTFQSHGNGAEMTNRLIPGDENYEYPEWVEYGTLPDGREVALYYRTSPEDSAMVEENGGDWGAIDWPSSITYLVEMETGKEIIL